MRGQAEAEGVASLQVVECLARAIRAERHARAERERRAAEGYRRLVVAILEARAAPDEHRAMAGAWGG